MEIDPVGMTALCIALLEHLTELGSPISGLGEGAVEAALLDLTAGMGMLVPDAATAEANIEALRPMVDEMSADDRQEGAAFCVELAAEL